MSTVIQRGKVWYAQWQMNGKTKMRATGIPVVMVDKSARETKKMAQQVAATFEQAAKGERTMDDLLSCVRAVGVGFGLGMSVPSVREYLSNIPGTSSESSEKNRLYAHRAFTEYLGKRADQPLNLISVSDCSGFIRDCEAKGFSRGSISLHKTYLSSAFKRAMVEDGYLSVNPWEAATVSTALKSVSEETTGRQAFSVDQMRTLLYGLGEKHQMWSDLAAASAMLGGARLSDCCSLRWDAVDWEADVVSFREIKTHQQRTLALVPELKKRLIRIREGQEEEEAYVFPELAREYRLYGSSTISSKFTRLLRQLGIIEAAEPVSKGRGHRVSALSFHSIRHLVCSLSSEHHNAAVAMSAVGHKSAAVHQRYVHISEEAQRGVLNDIAAALAA